MSVNTLTINLLDASGEPLADAKISVAPQRERNLLTDGDGVGVVALKSLSATSDIAGVATFELYASADIDSRYVVVVEEDGGKKSSGLFTMPDSDTTLAAAMAYGFVSAVRPPSQGWVVGSSAPSSPAEGDGWFNAEDNSLSVFAGGSWVEVTGASVDASQFVRLVDYNVHVGDIESDAQELEARVTVNETDIGTNTDDIAAAQTARSALSGRIAALEAASDGSTAGGLRHVEVPAIQHTTTFGLGDRVSNSVGAALYALDPPVEVGELVFVYQPDGDGDPDPQGWTIAVRVDDTATTAPFTQSTQFLQVLTAPMVGELETNTSFVSRLDALEAGGITVGTTAPTSPTDGALWFNPANQHLTTYDADTATWVAVAAGGDHDRIDANEANIAVNTANIQGEVNQRIAGDAALNDRVLELEGIDTSEQLVSPVTYNADDHTLTLHHQDGTSEIVTLGDPNQVETLLTTDDQVHITWYAGMGSETEVYEQPARSEDGGETPELEIANDPVNGNVLRNTSDTFVAGLSWVGDGISAGESVFLLGKFNITEDQPYQHTILSNYELTVALEARASETRFIFTPTGESSTTLTLPVAVGTNGVGDFILGIQLSDPSNANVTATVAINGAANAVAATHIGSMPSLAWSTRTNFGCRWETPLQDTPSINTFHLIGDAWDVVVGRRDTAWTANEFRALTNPTATAISNRTSLYADKFRVADAPIWSRGVHWSERATMPLDRDQPATVHHLRTYIPIARAVDLYFDVACTRQTTHDPQTFLHLPDVTRLRRAFIDLGDETVGDASSTADVRIDRAKLDQWVIADRAVTVTQQRDAPLWSLCAGWPSNYYVLAGAHHTWAACLIRANATADGCPTGHANYLAITGYIGTTPNGATERWMRLGVRT